MSKTNDLAEELNKKAEAKTKARKRKRHAKMKVSGKSVLGLKKIIVNKAKNKH